MNPTIVKPNTSDEIGVELEIFRCLTKVSLQVIIFGGCNSSDEAALKSVKSTMELAKDLFESLVILTQKKKSSQAFKGEKL